MPKNKNNLKINESELSFPRSNSVMDLYKSLEDRRLNEIKSQKSQREKMKACESLEEKRERRLREKRNKEIRRRQRMGWDTDYQHYTNQDNPFGDSNLMSSFVWNKKFEKDGLNNVSQHTVEVFSRQKLLENKIELEKVKKRRVERELERQRREDQLLVQQRSKEATQFQEWEKHEDKFHLEQARLRSIIRIQDGRAKPIDLLAQYISEVNNGIEIQMHEPFLLLNGLNEQDLEDLLVDINVYIKLEKGENIDFWNDMITIVKDELKKLNKCDYEQTGRREGIHQSVVQDVTEIFRGKNTSELEELHDRIANKLINPANGVDISYWDNLLSQLNAYMARSRLRDKHQKILQNKLKILKKVSDDKIKNMTIFAVPSSDENQRGNMNENSNEELLNEKHTKDVSHYYEQYEAGNYSPTYVSYPQINSAIEVTTLEKDTQALSRLRENLLEDIYVDDTFTPVEHKMRCEVSKGMLQDEIEFSVEVPINSEIQISTDKYRPRKPRYFNRVHTGFEWNKYNQTHYDMDNPPPKIVQGYKFNIFYPDLIKKESTPQYKVSPCVENPDFAVLCFQAGPPYEDIAFKIVNREWEFSYKRGFRCQFHNNIFQLWFHFKRYRYRR